MNRKFLTAGDVARLAGVPTGRVAPVMAAAFFAMFGTSGEVKK